MKVIVIGSSHGGYEAVEQLLVSYPEAQVQWYEKGNFLSFMA
ncbi:NADH peroxidase [Vagococcus humatus]|nr:NADH peroxidase [Vagococcus humatus]